MNATEEEKIMFQAKTIEFARSLKQLKLGKKFIVMFLSESDDSHLLTRPHIEANSTTTLGPHLWAANLAHQIFEPLINQGLERYIEEVNKIAEAGKVPERSA